MVESDLKPVEWIGSSYKDIVAFPSEVQDHVGYALYLAQTGGLEGKPIVNDDSSIKRGGTNLFAELGYPDADAHFLKAGLVRRIDEVIAVKGLTAREASDRIGTSALVTYAGVTSAKSV